jgi:hypothetical protein
MNGKEDDMKKFLIAIILVLATSVHARNIDLSTLPPRDSVQLTIYNSEDLTLVRETRYLTLKKGVNRIQYSWANTLIDPTSVEIHPLENEANVEVLDTTFPQDKPQHCIWNIDSKIEGQVKFQVMYFTSGVSWKADYVLTANPTESEMSFDGFIQIENNSGEDYENAQVRLVVGVVNLVEQISDLARRGMPQASAPQYARDGKDRDNRALSLKEAIDKAEFRKKTQRAPEIVKEGLSEYFIYTIEGEQTVPNGWSKRLSSFKARQVKFDILYRLRSHQYGERPVRFFVLKNDTEHKLGATPLPDGLVRTFRDNGKDGLAFLGQQSCKYVPIKADIELNVGPDDEVVVKHDLNSVERLNFAFNELYPNNVVGWDETRSWKDEIRNYKDKPIRMEIRYVVPGDIDLESEQASLFDFQTMQFTMDASARKTISWNYRYTQHMGRNAGQNQIELVKKIQ